MPKAFVRFHLREHLVTVHIRHHDVEEHEIVWLGLQQLQGLPAIGSGRDIQISLAGEPSRQRETIVLDVVDYQQRGVAIAHDVLPAGTSARILPSRRGSSTGLYRHSLMLPDLSTRQALLRMAPAQGRCRLARGYRKTGACPALSVQENDHQVRYRKCGSHEEENRRDPHDMIPRPANSPIGVFSCKEGDNKAAWE